VPRPRGPPTGRKSALPQLARNQFNFNSINDFARVAGSSLVEKAGNLGSECFMAHTKWPCPQIQFLSHSPPTHRGPDPLPTFLLGLFGAQPLTLTLEFGICRFLSPRKNGMINVRGVAINLNPLYSEFAYIEY